MTSGGRPCAAWAGTGSCGAPARLYPAGWRCDDHTPAKRAGRPEAPGPPPPPLGHRLDRPPAANPVPADGSPDQTEDTPMIQAALTTAAADGTFSRCGPAASGPHSPATTRPLRPHRPTVP